MKSLQYHIKSKCRIAQKPSKQNVLNAISPHQYTTEECLPHLFD